MEIQSSDLLLERAKEILDHRKDLIAESDYGSLLKAPAGGLGEKMILAANGVSTEDAKAQCLAIIEYLRQNNVPVKI